MHLDNVLLIIKGTGTFVVVLTGEHDPQASLQFHAGIVAGHKRLNDNRRSQIALEQLG